MFTSPCKDSKGEQEEGRRHGVGKVRGASLAPEQIGRLSRPCSFHQALSLSLSIDISIFSLSLELCRLLSEMGLLGNTKAVTVVVRGPHLLNTANSHTSHGDPQEYNRQGEENIGALSGLHGAVEIRRHPKLFLHSSHGLPLTPAFALPSSLSLNPRSCLGSGATLLLFKKGLPFLFCTSAQPLDIPPKVRLHTPPAAQGGVIRL